jgi:parallel beta-helix repeat protein
VTSTKNGAGFAFQTNSVLSKNVASGNGVGIFITQGSGGNTLYSNTAKNNGSGIIIDESNNIVQKNITIGNVQGISVAGAGNNLSGNESYSNSQNGIVAVGGASSNTYTSNKTESNLVDGIHVEGNNNTLTLNTARVSGDDGIEVIGSGNHFKDNHATQNTNDGLLEIPQGGANADDGKNTGDANGGIQCRIDGALCTP